MGYSDRVVTSGRVNTLNHFVLATCCRDWTLCVHISIQHLAVKVSYLFLAVLNIGWDCVSSVQSDSFLVLLDAQESS